MRSADVTIGTFPPGPSNALLSTFCKDRRAWCASWKSPGVDVPNIKGRHLYTISSRLVEGMVDVMVT